MSVVIQSCLPASSNFLPKDPEGDRIFERQEGLAESSYTNWRPLPRRDPEISGCMDWCTSGQGRLTWFPTPKLTRPLLFASFAHIGHQLCGQCWRPGLVIVAVGRCFDVSNDIADFGFRQVLVGGRETFQRLHVHPMLRFPGHLSWGTQGCRRRDKAHGIHIRLWPVPWVHDGS